MKISLENLGILDRAEFDLGRLTVICGENNTGKTYATYALYGFLKSWRQLLQLHLLHELKLDLGRRPVLKFDLAALFVDQIKSHLQHFSTAYTKMLPQVFAARKELFANASCHFSAELPDDVLQRKFETSLRSTKDSSLLATFSKPEGQSTLEVVLAEGEKGELTEFALAQYIAEAIGDIIFAPIFPEVFIASAERTGVAIFRNELDFARTRLWDVLGSKDAKAIINPFRLYEKIKIDYALPVQDNVNFVRQLESLEKETSLLLKDYPDILEGFEDIIGGTYKVGRDGGLYFIPYSLRTRLTMTESSSAVRALLDISFYLRHQAKPGDLFMIDEPELNLHPVNQRKLARLMVRLVNAGIKVFITTHSDYIIKEFNTLIMLGARTNHTERVRKQYRYGENELLSIDAVRLYITDRWPEKLIGQKRKKKICTLRAAHIDEEQGIEAITFDNTINEMNEIQDKILFGNSR